jgi:hypothetical protein
MNNNPMFVGIQRFKPYQYIASHFIIAYKYFIDIQYIYNKYHKAYTTVLLINTYIYRSIY